MESTLEGIGTPYFFDSIGSFDRTYSFTYILKFWAYLGVPAQSYSRRKTEFFYQKLVPGYIYSSTDFGYKVKAKYNFLYMNR